MPSHQKHAALHRPAFGRFHRQEWALIGAPCGRIQTLAQSLLTALGPDYRLGYVDADHAGASDEEALTVQLRYTDKIGFHRYDYLATPNEFDQRQRFQVCDAVLVNGNHFPARRQIVLLDPHKAESLSRKLDRLTDVALVLTTDEQPEAYDFLQPVLEQQSSTYLPLSDVEGIAAWFRSTLSATRPPLYGLVLAGGESRRMGEDKSLINYHGRPQREHVADLLAPLCERVFLSLQKDADFPTDLPVITDTFTGLGPYGALLSAFREQPDAAWLVVACDLPLLNDAALRQLIAARQPSRLATAFHNADTGWPDPLVTIWEPRAYPRLLQFLAQGYSCPRKVLINSDVEVIQPTDAAVLYNANHPAEREEVLNQLRVMPSVWFRRDS